MAMVSGVLRRAPRRRRPAGAVAGRTGSVIVAVGVVVVTRSSCGSR